MNRNVFLPSLFDHCCKCPQSCKTSNTAKKSIQDYIFISTEKQSCIFVIQDFTTNLTVFSFAYFWPDNVGMHRNVREHNGFHSCSVFRTGESGGVCYRRTRYTRACNQTGQFEHTLFFFFILGSKILLLKQRRESRLAPRRRTIKSSKTKVWFNHWDRGRLFTAHLLNVAFY